MNFTAARFVAKYHTMNSSQKSHLCRLYCTWDGMALFQSLPKIHDHRWESKQRPI